MPLLPREDRRDRSFRVGARRRQQHLALRHSGLPCTACQRTPWGFADRKPFTCGCSSHKRGSPKLSHGPCYGGISTRPAVQERRTGRRLCFLWLNARGDGEDLHSTLLDDE